MDEFAAIVSDRFLSSLARAEVVARWRNDNLPADSLDYLQNPERWQHLNDRAAITVTVEDDTIIVKPGTPIALFPAFFRLAPVGIKDDLLCDPTLITMADARAPRDVKTDGTSLHVLAADSILRLGDRTAVLKRNMPGQEFWLFPGGLLDDDWLVCAMKELNEETCVFRVNPQDPTRIEIALFSFNGETGITPERKREIVINTITARPEVTMAALQTLGLEISADNIDVTTVPVNIDQQRAELQKINKLRIGDVVKEYTAIPFFYRDLNTLGGAFTFAADIDTPESWHIIDGEQFGREARLAHKFAELAGEPAYPLLHDIAQREENISLPLPQIK